MLSRSSSFTSSTNEPSNANVKPSSNVRHHESLQNLPQSQRQSRPMFSCSLNSHQSIGTCLPHLGQHTKRTTATTTTTTGSSVLVATHNLPGHSSHFDKKTESHVEIIKRSIVQDDIENIQERLHGILITVPSVNEQDMSLLQAEQTSTTEYFTPKISIDDNAKRKGNDADRPSSQAKTDTDTDTDDDDDALDRKATRRRLRDAFDQR
jgi:hypothetical protein